jgi:hypothetical protein
VVYYLDGEVWLLLRGDEPVLIRLGNSGLSYTEKLELRSEVSENNSGYLKSEMVNDRPVASRNGKRQACRLPEK